MKSALGIALLSLVIAIIVAGMSLSHFQDYQILFQTGQTKLSKLESQLQNTTAATQALASRIDKMATEEQAILSKVNPTRWVLAESEYLVRLAALRLQVAQDVKTAILLLQTAEEKIQALYEPRFAPLAAAIMQDRVALQNTRVPNLEELWATVDVIMNQAKTLPTRGFQRSDLAKVPTTTQATPADESTSEKTVSQSPWQQSLVTSLQEMKDLVKIRYHSRPLNPALTEEEKGLAKENLYLILEQIRFAILTTQPVIYKAAIQNAQDWLQEYFETTNETATNIQHALANLAAVDLQPSLPSLSRSIEAFHAVRQ